MRAAYNNNYDLEAQKAELDRILAELQHRSATKSDLEKLGLFCERLQNPNTWPKHIVVQRVTTISKMIISIIAKSKLPLAFKLPEIFWNFFWQLIKVCDPTSNFRDLVTVLACMLHTFDRTNIEASWAPILSASNGYIYEGSEQGDKAFKMDQQPSKWDLGLSSSKQPQVRWLDDRSHSKSSDTNKLVAEWMSALMKQIYYLRSQDHANASFDQLYSLLSTDPATLGLAATSPLPLDPFVLSGLLTDIRFLILPLIRNPLHFKPRPFTLPPIISQMSSLIALQSGLIAQAYQVSSPADLCSRPIMTIRLINQTIAERTVFAVLYCSDDQTQAAQFLAEASRWITDDDSKLQLILMLWNAAFPPQVEKAEVLEQVFRLASKIMWVADSMQKLEFADKTMIGALSSLKKFKNSAMNSELPPDLVDEILNFFDGCNRSVSRLINSQEKAVSIRGASSQQQQTHVGAMAHMYSLLEELTDCHRPQVLAVLQALDPLYSCTLLTLTAQEWILYLISKCLAFTSYSLQPAGLLESLLAFGQRAYVGSLRVRYLLCLYECWCPNPAPLSHEQEDDLIEEEALVYEEITKNIQTNNKIAIWLAAQKAFDETGETGWTRSFDDLLVKLRYYLCKLSNFIADSCRQIRSTERIEDIMNLIEEELQVHFNQANLPNLFTADYIIQIFDLSTSAGSRNDALKDYLDLFTGDYSLIKMMIEIHSFAKVYHRHKLALGCSKLLVLILLHLTQQDLVSSSQPTTGTFDVHRSDSRSHISADRCQYQSDKVLSHVLCCDSHGLPMLLSMIGELCLNLAQCKDPDLKGWLAILVNAFSPYSIKPLNSQDIFSRSTCPHGEYFRNKLNMDILEASLFQPSKEKEPTKVWEESLLSLIMKQPEEFRLLLLYSRLLSFKILQEPDPFVRAFYAKELLGAAACFRNTVFQVLKGMFNLDTANTAGGGSAGLFTGSHHLSPRMSNFKAIYISLTDMKLQKIQMFLQLRQTLTVGFQTSYELGMFRFCNRLASEYIKYAELVSCLDDKVLGLLMKSEIKTIWTKDSILKDFLEKELGLGIEAWCFQDKSPEDIIKKHQMKIRQSCHERSIASVDNVMLLVWLTARDILSAQSVPLLGRLVGQAMLLDQNQTHEYLPNYSDLNKNKLCFRVVASYENHLVSAPSLLKLVGEEIYILVETLLENTRTNVRLINYSNPDRICQLLERGFLDPKSMLSSELFISKCGLLKLIAGAMQLHFVNCTPCPPGLPTFLGPLSCCLFWICVKYGLYTLARSLFELNLGLGYELPPTELASMALQITNASYRFKKNNKTVAIELLKAAKSGKRKSMRRMTMRRADSLKEFYKYSWLLAAREGVIDPKSVFTDTIIDDPKVPMILLGSYRNIWNSMKEEQNIHIIFRSDGTNWVYSTQSSSYATNYLKLIDLLVENEVMLRTGADENTSASKWWYIREQTEKLLDNQINSLEESLGLDILLFSTELTLSDPQCVQFKNNNKLLKEHALKTTLQNLTTYPDPSTRILFPRLNQLKAKFISSQQTFRQPLPAGVIAVPRTPKKQPTPIKSKASWPLQLSSAQQLKNPDITQPIHLYSPPQSRASRGTHTTQPILLLLDGLQHLVPFEHMSMLNEFHNTLIYRITHVPQNRPIMPDPQTTVCLPGFLSQTMSAADLDVFELNKVSKVKLLKAPLLKPGDPGAYYLINPKGDLKQTERRLRQFIGKFKGWVGKVGEEPNPREIVEYLQNHINFM
jgi:Peptidase family C50